MNGLIIAVFVAVYLGMALGRWPGFAINRTGVAMIGAVVLMVTQALSGSQAIQSIDFSTLAVLLTLMVLSGQYAASGFFDWVADRITHMPLSSRSLLGVVIVIAGVLSALMTNDVVVWATTPVLIRGLLERGLDPKPYLIALACAANAGSVATMIGNPQNLLIAHVGDLHFLTFVGRCIVPAVLAMGVVYLVIGRSKFMDANHAIAPRGSKSSQPCQLKPRLLLKAVLATIALIAIFIFVEDRGSWSLLIVALLLLNRKLGTERLLQQVDWQLLALFTCLFIVTGALANAPALAGDFQHLLRVMNIDHTAVLAGLSLLGSNTIGNVPWVMLLLPMGHWPDHLLYSLAIFSTLAGNLLIVGSVANIIVIEQAKAHDIHIGFGEFARIGVPVTLISFVLAGIWVMLSM
ncbi:Inner membrane protein YbiR [Marinomonas spartinae]|uniref:SLC13 family permease n=1 Tax=Marinomonas spartinae TaxID=1792290 RepID=UPI000808C64F|nr:SLC13 family permease [Marinomonas spartinae]SBS34650.1 Inner membrane protein YbiR [Marinomonas spartinae]